MTDQSPMERAVRALCADMWAYEVSSWDARLAVKAVADVLGPIIMAKARQKTFTHQADQPFPDTYPDWPSLRDALKEED